MIFSGVDSNSVMSVSSVVSGCPSFGGGVSTGIERKSVMDGSEAIILILGIAGGGFDSGFDSISTSSRSSKSRKSEICGSPAFVL